MLNSALLCMFDWNRESTVKFTKMAKTKHVADATQRVEEYFDSLPDWSREICYRLREIVLKSDPSIIEDWKWGPNYYSNGMLCGIAGFKKHVVLVFFQGVLLKDKKKLLIANQNALHNRHIKFTRISDINEKLLLEYLFEAVDNNKKGLKILVNAEKTVEVPRDVEAAFKRAGVLAYFNKLAYSHRKEYIQWIVSAKKEETRLSRIGKAIGKLGAGELMHDKYK